MNLPVFFYVFIGAAFGLKVAVILGTFSPLIGAFVGAVVGFASYRLPGRGPK